MQVLAHPRLLFRRQLLEAMVALPRALTLLGRELTPVFEARLRPLALFGVIVSQRCVPRSSLCCCSAGREFQRSRDARALSVLRA
jgi:hypothetical protein